MALQLPESEAHDVPNGRLLDKFPSTTTLWLVLRKFEAGVAGTGPKRNLTARGAPAIDIGNSGAGRLYYETPVIHVAERELSSFTDLQKSLSQLGVNSGNILLRLSFRTTQEPLEEAIQKISDYFAPFEDNSVVAVDPNIPEDTSPSTIDQVVPNAESASTTIETLTPASSNSIVSELRSESLQPHPSDQSAVSSVSSRPVTIFRPPSGSTPQSALRAHNEEDYVLSIEEAKSYQERLNVTSRPTRLPSDAEIAAKVVAQQEKLANITEVEVKIRFPEQSQVVAKFGQLDTSATLYSFARGCVNEKIASEPFLLIFTGAAGGPVRGGGKNLTIIPDSDQKLLIKDLGLRGRVLINFSWDDKASLTARGSDLNLLKAELRRHAQEIKVPDVPAEESNEKSTLGRLGAALRGDDGRSSRKGGTMPKWFKMPGKK